MNTNIEPEIKTYSILSFPDPDHPWRKDLAELRFDLTAPKGAAYVSPSDVARVLRIASSAVTEIEIGQRTTDAEGWILWEQTIRGLHEAATARSVGRDSHGRVTGESLTDPEATTYASRRPDDT